MTYNYAEQRHSIFTEDGQVLFLRIRDKTHNLIRQAGAARMGNIISGHTGDSWAMLACVDRLVELGEIREIAQNPRTHSQDRVFVSTKID